MHTHIINPSIENEMKLAAQIIKEGGTVVMPTETVYGLAADALNENAVEKIFKAKGRPSDNPLIIHVANFKDIYPLVKNIGEKAKLLAEKFWPGPLTMIFEKSDLVPSITSGGLDTVALRIPKDKHARELINKSGKVLAAPSANISGSPSPTRFEHVYGDLFSKVDAIIKGEPCKVGLESTVINMVGDVPKILRPGAVTAEEIASLLGEVEIDESIISGLSLDEEALSPGMKYKHYSPNTKIIVSHLAKDDYIKMLNSMDGKKVGALCFDEDVNLLNIKSVSFGDEYDPKTQAEYLFSSLHKIDKLALETVYARAPKLTGVGLAVYNRLIRAAGFHCEFPKVNVLGLTGQTGSGKSSIARILGDLGAAVIDCDKVTRLPDIYPKECLKQLQKTFSYDIINEAGELDRKKLSSYAFSSKENTEKLNLIVLPYIVAKIASIIEEYKINGKKLIVLDAPTLFEAGADSVCDKILVAKAPKELRLNRIIKRDNLSKGEALKRINSQKEEAWITALADFIIDTENVEEVRAKAEYVFDKLCHYRK